MKNSLNRNVPSGFIPFVSSHEYQNHLGEYKKVSKKETSSEIKSLSSISELFDYFNVKDGMTLSFHHHLRNGDGVLNMVCEEIKKRDLKNIHIAASSLFPNNDEAICDLIKNKNITKITTNYLNGKSANVIGEGYLEDLLVMETHGGRARSIETGELVIDLDFPL